ncbi:MAG: D-alanyl-D-alanine carboxypeptidase [Burkholderiales bacterium]|nr:D-alanyl-D-alanine carboxypeptidase [Burkholderiales bacterium]
MKKFLAACAALCLFANAAAQPVTPPMLAARSWLLMDATSGQILAAHEPDMRIEPASLTKLRTAYLAFAAVRDKRIDLQQTVNVSVNAWKVDGDSSKMFIEPSTPVRIQDLLYGLIVQSGNDAAITLAEAIAGNEATFVEQMNRTALSLGLKNTRFANPHGLPHAENYATARDLSTLANRLIIDFPELYKIYSTKSFTYNKITQPNRNRLLWLDPTVDGVKTGHTQAAGYCLIAAAKRPNGTHGDRRMLSVVLGTASDSVRAQESQKLLNWGFQNFETHKMYSKGQVVLTPTVWKGAINELKLGFNRDVYVTLPQGTRPKITTQVDRTDPLVAPIAQYTSVGTLKLLANDQVVNSVPLLALEPVPAAGIVGRSIDTLRLLLPN